MTQEEEVLLSLEDINPREIASHIEHGTLHQWIKSWKAETRESIIAALRPVSREQVEKVFPGCEKCHNQANWPSWIEKGFVYCPKCGTPLTSWAWEKQTKRLEALKDGKGD